MRTRVVIVLLSLVLLISLTATGCTSSYATDEQVQALQNQLQALQNQLQTLQDQLNSLTSQLDSTQQQLALTQQQLDSTQQQLSEAQSELQQQQSTSTVIYRTYPYYGRLVKCDGVWAHCGLKISKNRLCLVMWG